MTNEKKYKTIRIILIMMVGVSTLANGLLARFAHVNAMTDMSAAMSTELSALVNEPMNDSTMGAVWETIKPQGVPAVYGAALSVSYDDPVSAIAVMKQYDPYKQPNVMSAAVLERYTLIGLMISCEYCCSAKTLVFDNGVAACGCAHSMAMRGLARYLLEAYPNMTNEDILAELVQWKALYFPKDASAKALTLTKSGQFNSKTYLINNIK